MSAPQLSLLARDSPSIEITLSDNVQRGTPLRPSLDVTFTFPNGIADEVFRQGAQLDSSQSSPFRSRSDTGDSVNLDDSQGHRGRLDSFKDMLKELSPKMRRRRKQEAEQMNSSSTDASNRRKAFQKTKHSAVFSQSLEDNQQENWYFGEGERRRKRSDGRKHSLDNLLSSKQTSKHSLVSSFRNLFHLSKSDEKIEKGDVLDAPARAHKHIRQSSDSLIIDLRSNLEVEETPARRATMDNDAQSALMKFKKARKQQKASIFIDSSEANSDIPLALISVPLVVMGGVDNIDLEVQRLELSEVAAGISRLKHAESNDHISQMDDKSTMARIEKLFPYDDLELNSTTGKKPRRRRSAPSQILLKNFRPASKDMGSNSKISQTTSLGTSSTDFVTRKFICESPVQLTDSAGSMQDRYLFLFNDLLFIAKQKSTSSYKLKTRVLLCDSWMGSVADFAEFSHMDPNKSIIIGWPTVNFVATFTSKELCDRWKMKLQSQINEELNREEAASVTVQVVHREYDTITLTMNKDVDAREMLQASIKEFGIQNARDVDYQLLVLSSTTKDASIEPLIGVEQPFTIQLSHERDAEELDPNIKCQFILRENKKQMKDRKLPKSTKKKKMQLSNIFRKASGKLPSSPRSNSITEGKIFGHPLDQICDPDIPTPLMELLDNLYNHGPFTTEIFRKPSNAKKCQEMVNFMNSTEPEGWCKGCHNGILYASILKTFLRELPGKLCCSEFYNQWSNAINLPRDEERVVHLQRIIEKLPKGNQLVLRYIVCILSHIQDKSDSNLMTSYNLAVCLGPSLLWNESSEMSEQEASSKTVPQVVQFLIDNCQSVFGEDILDMFGHPPIAPEDSDIEELEVSDRIHTPYNDSLESLSDSEPPLMGGLTQMSPSSCSRDSGLILSDPHENGGEHSDDHSLRQEITKSKSFDSLNQNETRRLRKTLPLQTQVSSDSLDCDDEYIELDPFTLTKSLSGGHLCFDKQVEKTTVKSNARLQSRLDSMARGYTEIPSASREVGYSSSDSNKSLSNTQKNEWVNSELQKSSTSSSLQQGSSSSDDAFAIDDIVTHRHINSPKILESESGYHPTDFLRQFDKTIQNKQANKNKLRELVRIKTDSALVVVHHNNTDDVEKSRRQSSAVHRSSSAHRHLKNPGAPAPARVTRTNTYAGRSELRHRGPPPDVNMAANMAEMQPIMPQQYKPHRPPTYREAIERKEKLRTGASIPEIERLKQKANNARAKKLYAKSLELFEQQESRQHSSSGSSVASDSHSVSTSNHSPSTTSITNTMVQANLHDNNNTIGIVKTSNKKFVIKRATSSKVVPPSSKVVPPPKPSRTVDHRSNNIFYQPGNSGHITRGKAPTIHTANSLASSFYRPTQPPPYKEAVLRNTSKPDLIDSLGGESLV